MQGINVWINEFLEKNVEKQKKNKQQQSWTKWESNKGLAKERSIMEEDRREKKRLKKWAEKTWKKRGEDNEEWSIMLEMVSLVVGGVEQVKPLVTCADMLLMLQLKINTERSRIRRFSCENHQWGNRIRAHRPN